MKKKNNLIQVGASGWYYEHWDKIFYPEKLKSAERLPFYAEYFNTVEINNTFYRLPSKDAVTNWYERTPENFIFSIKASRYITHIKRLKIDSLDRTNEFFDNIKLLKHKLGPILFQLPPSFKYNHERIVEFIEHLPKDIESVFEFRHPTWYVDEIYQLLQKNKIALCVSDLNGKLSPIEVTAKFTYIRLHGPHLAYRGYYSKPQLKKWAQRLEEWASHGITSYCYFDNDEKGYAIQDAQKLKEILGL